MFHNVSYVNSATRSLRDGLIQKRRDAANVAGLYALAATCEARGINPMEYFTDVLTRFGDHPASRLDDLLPGAWAATQP